MSLAIARKVARQMGSDPGASVPVDLVELLQFHGLTLEFEEGWPRDLCARYYAGEALVVVNSRHGLARQRFSIAHELGHHALGHAQLEVDIDHRLFQIFGDETETFEVIGDLERDANAFAAELLMPRGWVSKAENQISITKDLAAHIARECQVSEAAAWVRMMELKVGGFATTRNRKR